MFNHVLLFQGGHIRFLKNEDTEKKLKHWLQILWLKEMFPEGLEITEFFSSLPLLK